MQPEAFSPVALYLFVARQSVRGRVAAGINGDDAGSVGCQGLRSFAGWLHWHDRTPGDERADGPLSVGATAG
jgi:hypothetical protein